MRDVVFMKSPFPAVLPMSPTNKPRILLHAETHEQGLAALQHGSLDHRRLLEHERERLAFVEIFLCRIRQLAKGRAGAIEQRFPPDGLRPSLERHAIDP